MFDLKLFRKVNKLTQFQLADYLGVTQGFISQVEKGIRPIPDEYISKIIADNLYKIPTTKHIDEAVLIENPNLIMVPLVSQYAYAGYLVGHTDPVYIETLPKVPMLIDHEIKGTYMVFEVRGDSMEEESREGIYEGDRLQCRLIKQDLWQFKLHIKQWDFVIVHKSEGILIKRIIAHNTDTGDITIHSLNPMYPDRTLNLRDVSQLFNVVEITRGRKR